MDFCETFGSKRCLGGCKMNPMKDNNDWNEKDAVWDLLGKAMPKEASGRFADDTLRAVRLLPEADP